MADEEVPGTDNIVVLAIERLRKDLSGRIDKVAAEVAETRHDLGARIDQTNVRLEQTNARLDETIAAVRELNARTHETNAEVRELKLEVHRLGQSDTSSIVERATREQSRVNEAVLAMLTKNYDLRDRVENCEHEIVELKRRLDVR
jgi:methyl-accepting chemotaxis protein